MREVRFAVVVVLLVLGVFHSFSLAVNVTYDHRALVIDGKRRVLVSGSIHYPRSTPEVRLLRSWNFDVLALRIFFSSLLSFLNRFAVSGICRCGRTLFRNLRTEVWMWLRLMFSGIYMNRFETRYIFANSSIQELRLGSREFVRLEDF